MYVLLSIFFFNTCNTALLVWWGRIGPYGVHYMGPSAKFASVFKAYFSDICTSIGSIICSNEVFHIIKILSLMRLFKIKKCLQYKSFACLFHTIHHWRLDWVQWVYYRAAADYYEVVATPIDLRKIQQKLKMEEYEDIDQLTTDVELLVSNAKLYYKVRTVCNYR